MTFSNTGYHCQGNIAKHVAQFHPGEKSLAAASTTADDVAWCRAQHAGSDSDSGDEVSFAEEPDSYIDDREAEEAEYTSSSEEESAAEAAIYHDPASPSASPSRLYTADWYAKYPDGDRCLPRSTFPFASKASYRFHLWCCLRGHKIAATCIDVLLSIFEDELPGFAPFKRTLLCGCKTVRAFMNKMDRRIPAPSSEAVAVARTSTAYDASNNKRKVTVSTKVDVASISSCLEFVFATPDMRRHVVMGTSDVGDGPVHEFNETPFVRNAFDYQKLNSFRTDDEIIRVGDFVHARGNNVFRVEELLYARTAMSSKGCSEEETEGTLLPKLHLRGRMATCEPATAHGIAVHLREDEPLVQMAASCVLRKLGPINEAASRTASAGGGDVAYEPLKVLRTPTAVTSGDPFVWLNFYIDKFESVGKNKKSTEAIYMEIANVDSRFSSGQEFVFTIALLSSGCSLAEAWEPQRKELAAMVKGGIELFDAAARANVLVGVGVAGLIGDHMQQVVNTRTFGPSGTLNSRACSWRKDECCEVTKDGHASCQHFTLARRNAQTEVAIAQINEALRLRAEKKRDGQYTRSAYDEECKHYGLRPYPCMWRECGVDPHRQAWWDVAHLLFLGIIKLALKCIVEGLSAADQEVFQTRIRLFPWPKSCSPPFNAIKANFGAGVTIEGWRLMSLASMWALEGLANEGDLRWVIKMHYCATDVMGPLTASDVDRLAVTTRELVTEGRAVVGDGWKDKPNIHGLLELPWHTLAALRSGRFSDTRKFEKRNKFGKGYADGSKSGKGGQGGEGNAMKYDKRLVSHRAMSGGLRWGPGRIYGLGSDLVGMRDPRPHRTQYPHPEIRRLTRLAPTAEAAPGSAHPRGRGRKQSRVDPASTPPPPTPTDQDCWIADSVGGPMKEDDPDRQPYTAFATSAISEQYGVDLEPTDITAMHRVARVRSRGSHRTELISPGDDVACTWGNDGERGRHHCRVHRIVLVVAHSKSYLFLAPRWYKYPATGPRMHKLRGTELVVKGRWPVDQMYQWLAFSSINYQVGVVHSCIRSRGPKACVTGQFCVAHPTRRVTTKIPCPECGKSGKIFGNDHHCETNEVYEVIDQGKGFVATTELDDIY